MELFAVSKMPAKAIIFVAHPDDEVFCGGLICSMCQMGTRVTLAILTRGEGARNDKLPPARLAEQRTEEVINSAEALGIHDVRFLGYPDPPRVEGRLPAPVVSETNLQGGIRQILSETGASIVVTHGSDGEYGHPAHRLMHRVVKNGLKGSSRIIGLGMNAWRSDFCMKGLLNRMDFPRFLVDGTAFEQERIRSLRCHKSQVYIFEDFARGSAEDYVRKSRLEYYSILHR